VPVYTPAFSGTHCTFPRRDGQAELTCKAGYRYILRWLTHLPMVTHPGSNRVRHPLTSLIGHKVLTITLSSVIFSTNAISVSVSKTTEQTQFYITGMCSDTVSWPPAIASGLCDLQLQSQIPSSQVSYWGLGLIQGSHSFTKKSRIFSRTFQDDHEKFSRTFSEPANV